MTKELTEKEMNVPFEGVKGNLKAKTKSAKGWQTRHVKKEKRLACST